MIVAQELVVNAAEAAAIDALAGKEVHNPYPVWSGAAQLWEETFHKSMNEFCGSFCVGSKAWCVPICSTI